MKRLYLGVRQHAIEGGADFPNEPELAVIAATIPCNLGVISDPYRL